MGKNNKSKQQQQRQQKKGFRMSKRAVWISSAVFVVAAVLLGVVLSRVMDDSLAPPSVQNREQQHQVREYQQRGRGFSAADQTIPGLDDPLYEVTSSAAVEPLDGTRARGVCAGGHYTAALDAADARRVWVWGLVAPGTRVLTRPRALDFDADVAEIACGSFQLLVRTAGNSSNNAGTVFSVGASTDVCHSDEDERESEDVNEDESGELKVQQVEGLEGAGPVVQMSAGYNSNAFLAADGALYFQGARSHGPFAPGTGSGCLPRATRAALPPGVTRVRAVSLGSRFTGIIAEGAEGAEETDAECTRVFFAGTNAFGAMGVAPAATDAAGGVRAGRWVEAVLPQEQRCAVAELACGGDHTLVRAADGTVLGAGWNERGQLGTHDREDRDAFEPLALGADAEAAEHPRRVAHAVAGPYSASLVLWDDGTLSVAGSVDSAGRGTDAFEAVELADGADGRPARVAKAALGFMHAALLMDDGSVRTFGNGLFGHLGVDASLDASQKNNEFTQRWSSDS